ncbi:MAG: fumarylacetoacetate hydrolase family protein [Mycobacteriaceae bacterium]
MSTTLFDPYGVFAAPGRAPRVGVRRGGQVLDLAAACAQHAPEWVGLFDQPSLDSFLAAGPEVWAQVHAGVAEMDAPLLDLDGVELLLPFTVADYVDFYSSEVHARDVSKILRPERPTLPPAWHQLPIGYHGRAGTVVVSGTEIARPRGILGLDADGRAVVGPSERLDLEAELGFVVGTPSSGPVGLADAAEHVFGVVVVNDWSARDVQAFETVPLGPMLGKAFATSVSAWVTPLAALDAARVSPPARVHPVAEHLDDAGRRDGLDVTLRVHLNGELLAEPPAAGLYWTWAQQLAHLSGGARMRTGDLLASGTVSGDGAPGSLLELSWGGSRAVAGTGQHYLRDGDEVVITAIAPAAGGGRVELGEVRGRITA